MTNPSNTQDKQTQTHTHTNTHTKKKKTSGPISAPVRGLPANI